MKLPPIHNTRSPQQWEIISKHIDFKGKTVLDLGCGYGDLLFRCWETGAGIWAVEYDEEIRGEFWKRLEQIRPKPTGSHMLYTGTIESFIPQITTKVWDVIICFSVLPYLKQPFTVLEWIKEHSEVALIECQYKNDGPGFDLITDDGLMAAYLERVGWQSVEPIGKTFVEGREKWRTIWLCQ